jgi:hypothetical protein
MRRSVSIIAAAAILAASSIEVAPAQAAGIAAAPLAASANGGIMKTHDAYRHHRRDRHRQYSYRRRQVPPFFYGFPFPFRPYAYQYPRYRQDCFRTWDGRLYCRTY